jgi:hypothetical protein
MNKTNEELIEEFENLKCVNGAMYFGSVSEEQLCDCKESCRNSQTWEMAEKEYKEWLNHALETIEKRTEERIIEKMDECEKFEDEIHCTCLATLRHFITNK